MKNDLVFRILFTKVSQLKAFLDNLKASKEPFDNIDRIYLDSDMAMSNAHEVLVIQRELSQSYPKLSWFLSLPAVLREEDTEYLESISLFLKKNPQFQGLLCGNLEGIGYFLSQGSTCNLIADHNFYLWNKEAVRAWDDKLSGACIPLELNGGEQNALLKSCSDLNTLSAGKADKPEKPVFAWDKIVYGYLPLMFTANCVAKTAGECRKGNKEGGSDIFFLKDRTGTAFPVILNCKHCFNTILNSVPLSLHAQIKNWQGQVAFRLQFTIEDATKTREILSYFLDSFSENHKAQITTFTNGHEKRGVT